MEEGYKDSAKDVRPVGALETLGDALTAAFDEEMARWRGAAQSYCATLRDETHRCRRQPQQHEPVPDEPLVLVGGEWGAFCDGAGESSAGRTDSVSQSDPSASNCGRSELSLAEKWAELEELLTSIRPTLGGRKRPEKKVEPLSRQRTRQLQRDIGGWRLRSQGRRRTTMELDTESDSVAGRHALCKETLDAWRRTVRAKTDKRAKNDTAHLHWCQSKLASCIRAWRSRCLRQRVLRDRDEIVTQAIRSNCRQAMLQRWRIVSRWTRGHRRLKQWADVCRLHCAMIAWRELVETVRRLKSLRKRSFTRQISDAFAIWRTFRSGCLVSRERARLARQFILRRHLSSFRQGTRIMRTCRAAIAGLRQRHAVKTLRRVLETWIRNCEFKRKTATAIAWRRHCLQSACFETWHLLHRCYNYHKQITMSADAHYASCRTKQLFRKWFTFVRRRQMHREAITKLTRQILMRACLRHLQRAVQADRDRGHQLLVWKTQRRISSWYCRAHTRHKLTIRYQTAQKLHRRYTLHCVVWTLWRKAYLSRLETKRLLVAARRHVLQTWWKRWREYERWKQARHAMLEFVEDAWKHKKQRGVIQEWQKFCIQSTTQRAKLDVSTRHHILALYTRSLYRWRLWIRVLRQARQCDTTACQFYSRLVLHRWSRRAQGEKRRDETNLIQILHRRPLWLVRSSLATWRRHVASRICNRQGRLFRLWRGHSARLAQLRSAQLLSQRMWIRRLWVRWTRHTVSRTRARVAYQLLRLKSRRNMLQHCFHDVWRATALRFRHARLKLQCVSMTTTKRVCLKRWRQRVVIEIQARRAADHYRVGLWRRYFQRLYQYAVLRPQAFRHDRVVRIQSLVFTTWKTQYAAQQSRRETRRCLDCWKKHRVLQRLLIRVSVRQQRDQQLHDAAAFHRRCLLTRTVEKWSWLTTSRATCQAAASQVRTRRLGQVFAGWRHAFARSNFVRGLERQYEEAWRLRCWHQLVLAIQQRQEARAVWLSSLSSILKRKVLSRWRQLVDLHRVAHVAADGLLLRMQQKLLQVALDEWVHFTTVRAFVHLRERREHYRIQRKMLHCWKVYVLAACHHRRCDQRIVTRGFHAWRKHALMKEAARAIKRRFGEITLGIAWKTWRLEFWIRQSQLTSRFEILRRCLNGWKSWQSKNGASTSKRPMRRPSAFDEARLLHHAASYQRLLARRVVHAWALAAQTSRRQRAKNSSPVRRVLRLEDFKNSSSRQDHRLGCDKDESSSIRCDQENVNPNARTTTRRSVLHQPLLRVRRDIKNVEAMALEFWSIRMLTNAFRGWRSLVAKSGSHMVKTRGAVF